MKQAYETYLNVDEKQALEMARFTRGYTYAYQILGYLCFKNNYSLSEAIPDFDRFISENVYKKLWSELSGKDQETLRAIAKCDSNIVKDIRNTGNIQSNTFSVYKERLQAKGLIASPARGKVILTLPRFREFILQNSFDDEEFF